MTRGTALKYPVWLVSGTLSMSGLAASLNQTLVIPLLPIFPIELGVSADAATWLVTITLLIGAISVPTLSRLADLYGKRPILLVCLAIMAAGALISALANGYAALFIGRALAGFGMALIPIGMSILRDTLPPERVGSAVALMSATLGFGGALGLPLSGLIYDAVGWRWVFGFMFLVPLLLIAAVLIVVRGPNIKAGGRFDFIGATALSVVIAGVLLVVSRGSIWEWTSFTTIGLSIFSIVVLAAWIPFQLRTRDPILHLRTMATRTVAFTNIAAVFVGFALFVSMLLAMQQLQAPLGTGYGLGLSVTEAGLWMVPSGLAMVVLSPLNGYLLNRVGGKAVLIAGTVIIALGYVARNIFYHTPLEVSFAAALVSIGTAFAYAAMPTLIMSAVPLEQTASANGLNTVLRQVGTSVSSAAVAAVVSITYVLVDGGSYPTWNGIVILNIVAAVAALVGGAAALAIPRSQIVPVH
ncbi:MFS transporter [Leucobacter denitrificans]|uniref:MFS transporter n=1 Tax=Leucobacter denitrificans TaxID=683042 RepID=A0A7G9S535_9MICO|nr:MFS transporter [Leucobacter denitrificans]QNN62960.1 MFS transporter [Leucobacter denitrificans]